MSLGLISSEEDHPPGERPFASIRALQDGSVLRTVFFSLLVISIYVVGIDLHQMMNEAPEQIPGSSRTEPYPMTPGQPGDQVRPYLPRTMPISPNRKKPDLPGYFGPLNGEALSGDLKFYRGNDGRATAIGRINVGAAVALEAFLLANAPDENGPQLKTLILHSPGGSLNDALRMARMVRKAGMATEVPDHAYCASSCPIVMSGGVTRTAGDKAWIGVHQMYAPQTTVGSLHRGMRDAQSMSAITLKLLSTMGVDPELWIFAMQTPPAELYMLNKEEMEKFKLVTKKEPAKTGS